MSDKEYLENIIKTCLKESVDEYLDTDYEGYKKLSNDVNNELWHWYRKNSNNSMCGISPGDGDMTGNQNMIVYHSCKPSALKGLAQNGFSRQFTADNGNCYGSGVYTTLTPTDRTSGYGDAIVKCVLIDGLKDFIIFPKDIRDIFHGRGITLQQEIENVIGKDPEAMEEIKRRTSYYNYKDDDRHDNAYYFNQNASGGRLRNADGYTTNQADEHLLNKAGVRGFVYKDGHGIVVLVRDFNSLIPYQATSRKNFDLSRGKNWEYLIQNSEDFDRMNNNTDVYFSFSGKYPQTGPEEVQQLGYARVHDYRGYNYVNVRTKDVILPIPADQALPFTPDKTATFTIDGIDHRAKIMPNGEVKLFWRGSGFPLSKEMFARKVEAERNKR
jgi:hypothetical protein